MTKPDAEQVEQVEAYQEAVRRVALVARMLADVDFEKLLRAIDHADSVGPLLEPTLYIQKAQAMREDRTLLAAAQALVGTLKAPTRKRMRESDV